MGKYGEAPRGEAFKAQIAAIQSGVFDFELYPELWKGTSITGFFRDKTWKVVRFCDPQPKKISTKAGIYLFVVSPYCGGIKDHSYVFYVGQTKNFSQRYKEYLYEKKGLGTNPRPKVVRFLNHFQDFLFFHFTEISESELNFAEDLLKDNLTPPGNDKKTIFGRLKTGED